MVFYDDLEGWMGRQGGRLGPNKREERWLACAGKTGLRGLGGEVEGIF